MAGTGGVAQDVTKDGPANKAGIRPLDRIDSLDGTAVSSLTSAEARLSRSDLPSLPAA